MEGLTIQNPAGLVIPACLKGSGLILPFRGKHPLIGKRVFLAPQSSVIGEVALGDDVSIWFGVVIRGDIACIEVGRGSNIQDNTVLHVGDEDPCLVGEDVVVGHGAVLHGCRIQDRCTIGMGAVVLNGALIEEEAVVGAGALVPPRMVVPPRALALGQPARIVRELSAEELEQYAVFAPKYVRVAEAYRHSDVFPDM